MNVCGYCTGHSYSMREAIECMRDNPPRTGFIPYAPEKDEDA